MPENFVVEPLCAVFQKNSGSKKIYEKEVGGGSIKSFCRKFFCLLVPKNFIGEPFSVSIISVIEKFYVSKAYEEEPSRFSVEKVLSHSTETF